MTDKDDKDKTPVEPLMGRKRSSQRAMTAIGWVDCPACMRDGKLIDKRADCSLCFDEEDQRFNRKVPVDVSIRYLKDHPELLKKP